MEIPHGEDRLLADFARSSLAHRSGPPARKRAAAAPSGAWASLVRVNCDPLLKSHTETVLRLLRVTLLAASSVDSIFSAAQATRLRVRTAPLADANFSGNYLVTRSSIRQR